MLSRSKYLEKRFFVCMAELFDLHNEVSLGDRMTYMKLSNAGINSAGNNECQSQSRRSFIEMTSAGALAAVTLGGPPSIPGQTQVQWQPQSHSLDDWYDQVPGKHRLIFDSITPDGFGLALLFAANYIDANNRAYDLKDSDSAVIMVVRHKAIMFGFNHAVWDEYHSELSGEIANTIPNKTGVALAVNDANSDIYVEGVRVSNINRLDALISRGVHVAICENATRSLANTLSAKTGKSTETLFNDLRNNLVRSGHLVAAGILAVARAQEHGYALAVAM